MKKEDIKYIVIHCSATNKNQFVDADIINGWHKDRGWAGIGYHYVILRSGAIERGRPLGAMGAHVKGYNNVSWGICLVGGLNSDGDPDDNFTPAQFESLQSLTAALRQAAPTAEIVGHRDLSPDVDGDGVVDEWEWLKACPCFDVKSKLDERYLN